MIFTWISDVNKSSGLGYWPLSHWFGPKRYSEQKKKPSFYLPMIALLSWAKA